MIWKFKRHNRRVYPRNPLDTVVAQLKFQPILRIGAGGSIADYQDLIRSRFPGFGEGEIRSLTVGPDTNVASKSEKVFHFLRDTDKCQVQLSADNVLVETKDHKNRDDLLADLEVVVGALEKVYSPIQPTRFGVRYINVVKPSVISRDLDREVSWRSIISEDYLEMPASVADLKQTVFANQITSPMAEGALTLRYGIPPVRDGGVSSFNFDIDRYVESPIDLAKIDRILIQLTDDIFSLFNTLPGTDLLDWMSNQEILPQSGDVH